ncbi:hypothetical protein [Fundidesulfovibrio agrisoli]|uniref:bestrophin-like domain n=1 Tax=Fundidesulfovibrio agrisoli TaxID=2922717 RepID=UPI001FAD3E8E|nr:hypothetical protein [Fundidesulfovibrio agrisoli]
MNFTATMILLAVGFCLGILGCLELGKWLGTRSAVKRPDEAKSKAAATLEAAVFGLVGLLIAFTFSGATSRFDHRRHLIVEEANAIGTAWLRLDVLPQSAQPAVKELFRKYVDSRLATYAAMPDLDAAHAELGRTVALQNEIWKAAVAACQTEEGQRAGILVLPALNNMIDITTTRTMATLFHPPSIIFALMFGLVLGSMVMVGYDHALAKSRSWVHIIGFAALMAITVFIIMDLEYPRLGLIRVDDFDRVLRELRQSMG